MTKSSVFQYYVFPILKSSIKIWKDYNVQQGSLPGYSSIKYALSWVPTQLKVWPPSECRKFLCCGILPTLSLLLCICIAVFLFVSDNIWFGVMKPWWWKNKKRTKHPIPASSSKHLLLYNFKGGNAIGIYGNIKPWSSIKNT